MYLSASAEQLWVAGKEQETQACFAIMTGQGAQPLLKREQGHEAPGFLKGLLAVHTLGFSATGAAPSATAAVGLAAFGFLACIAVRAVSVVQVSLQVIRQHMLRTELYALSGQHPWWPLIPWPALQRDVNDPAPVQHLWLSALMSVMAYRASPHNGRLPQIRYPCWLVRPSHSAFSAEGNYGRTAETATHKSVLADGQFAYLGLGCSLGLLFTRSLGLLHCKQLVSQAATPFIKSHWIICHA